jgi:Flavin-binding monooxygenase-like
MSAVASDRHLIMGAGFAGLGVAKAFADAGIPYDHVEADDAIGGNWYHGVYDSTHLISSRDSTEYADHPMPREYPDFPSRDQMLAYLNSVADAHGLRGRIEFETEVSRVEPLSPHGMSGWRVTLAGGETREYRGVVVCNGHHWAKRIPEYPGTFSGKTLHSKDYKRPSDFAGRRVLVVGAGNSACDIAVEAAREGLETWISIRRGTHFLPKTIFGVPTSEIDRWWLPTFAQKALLKALLRIVAGPNELYGLPAPEHDIFDRHPTVNSDLLHALRHGILAPKPDVARLDGKAVEFTDGSRVEVDTIVWATGFDVAFPFLDRDLFEWEGKYPKLAGVMPPGIANLYVFGLGQPRGGAGPLITAGSRLLARIVLAQRDMDHPIASDLARLRKPEARELFGVSEMKRQIMAGTQVVRLLHWRARRARARRGEAVMPPPVMVAAANGSGPNGSGPDGAEPATRKAASGRTRRVA